MMPLETCIVNGDEAGVQACQATLKQVPAPETPGLRLIFDPEGLSSHELEKLAEGGTAQALEILSQALSLHEKKLADIQPHKTGRSALLGGQEKRLKLLERLVAGCKMRVEKV